MHMLKGQKPIVAHKKSSAPRRTVDVESMIKSVHEEMQKADEFYRKTGKRRQGVSEFITPQDLEADFDLSPTASKRKLFEEDTNDKEVKVNHSMSKKFSNLNFNSDSKKLNEIDVNMVEAEREEYKEHTE